MASTTLLPADPSSPKVGLDNLRERAGRLGYSIKAHGCGDFSLIDCRLQRPVVGLEYVGLSSVAAAVEQASHTG